MATRNIIARPMTGPTPLPPVLPDPPQLAGRPVASAHATSNGWGGLPDPDGGQFGRNEATYTLTIDMPGKVTQSWPRPTFGDVVREAQRRAIASGGVAWAVLQARDGTFWLAAVRYAKPIPGQPGFMLLENPKVATLDVTRAASAVALLAIVGTSSGCNFSGNPWPSGLAQSTSSRASLHLRRRARRHRH